MVIEYLILFTVVKLVCMMAMMSVTVRIVMEILTMLMVVVVVPMAFICISVCVIKQCVPTRQQHSKLRNFNDVFASINIECTDQHNTSASVLERKMVVFHHEYPLYFDLISFHLIKNVLHMKGHQIQLRIKITN